MKRDIFSELIEGFDALASEGRRQVAGRLAQYELIIKAAEMMTEAEKRALQEWESTNITGDGEFATSDWPGWASVLDRARH
ncbi:hypothetical protein [Metapseudomonas furukawaii]|nr:hypothetical protein [Pseudomonas furukawaii]